MQSMLALWPTSQAHPIWSTVVSSQSLMMTLCGTYAMWLRPNVEHPVGNAYGVTEAACRRRGKRGLRQRGRHMQRRAQWRRTSWTLAYVEIASRAPRSGPGTPLRKSPWVCCP
jgi:hypothetical protein